MGAHLRGCAQGGVALPHEPAGEPAAPVIIVHSLAHATAALSAAAQAGRPVVLASAPGAGCYGGAGWFAALARAAHAVVPGARFATMLDCSDDAAAAMAAIAAAIDHVVFVGRDDVANRLAEIAGPGGGRLHRTRLPADLDLGEAFFACAAALQQLCAEAFSVPVAFR